MQYLGEASAIGASFLFSASSTIFTLASRRVGAVNLNRLRLVFAIGWLLLAHLILGLSLPFYASAHQWLWFAISGLIGLALGDLFLFQSFIWIGPRLAMLLMALAPALTALFARIMIGETLSTGQILGIAMTIGGIAWVVSDRNGNSTQPATERKFYLSGILYGLGAAACQALGLVTAKLGLAGGFPALSGTLIRMAAAAIVLWGFAFIHRQAGTTIHKLSEQSSVIWLILAGSFAGPFLGVTLSLVAVQNTETGVASTLTSLTPLILLPVGYFFFHERFGWRAVLGTFLAMAGVALLFLV
jgi:drug/metabolite transporter (DMT)-like permease